MSRIFFVFSFLIIVFSWLMPGHYLPWVSAYQDFFVFFSGLLLALGFFCSLREFRVPVFFYGFILIIFFPFVQYVFGVVYFFGDAFIASVYLFGFFVMLLVGYNLSIWSSRKAFFVRVGVGALILGCGGSVWIALRQWLLLSGGIWEADLPLAARPFANLAQPNNLATLLCMGVTGVLYLYETRILGRLAGSVLAFFLLVGVVLSQSRTPWIGAMVLTVFWIWKSHIYGSNLSRCYFLLWVFIYYAGVFLLPVFGDILQLSVANLYLRAGSFERFDIWRQLCHAVLNGPLLGYGWNQVSVAQVAVTQIYSVPIMIEHSHNVLLDILIWNGILVGVGVIGYLSCLVLLLIRGAHSAEGLFGLSAAVFVLVHGMFEYPLEYAYLLLPLGLLLGVVTADLSWRREMVLPRWLLGLVLVVCCGGWAFIWYEYRVIDEDYRLMRFESAHVGSLKADKVSPHVLVLTQLKEYIRFARTPASEGMSADELNWMRNVARRYPYLPILFRYSLALGLNGDFEGAREQLLILKSLYGQDAFIDAKNAMSFLSVRYPDLARLNF